MRKLIEQTKQHISSHWKAIIVLIVGIVLSLFTANFLIIQSENNFAYTMRQATVIAEAENINIGIVFGGGVAEGQPLPLLADRLLTAKQLLDNGSVDKLILSGDNRQLNYNEPSAMMNYLINELGADESQLQPDFAGRSTYETCERASKVFSVKKALLITESTHLPRAIYLCRHFKIEAFGVQSDNSASAGLKIGQRWREVLARSKAIFNVYIYGEQTVLGNKIQL